MLTRLFTLLSPTGPHAAHVPDPGRSPVATGGPFNAPPLTAPAFTAPRRIDAQRPSIADGADRHQQLIGLALENLLMSARRSSVSDMTAAAIDLKRVAHGAGKVARDLLNKPDPSGSQILDCVAQTRIDIRAKLDVLISMGCQLNAVNRAGENVLHAAARHNNSSLVDALSIKGRALVHDATSRVPPYSQATPLAVAVISGHADLARQFLLLGASLSTPCCVDADMAPLNAPALYAQLDNRTPAMSTALRTTRASGS